ncbi:MAG TPA: Tol-Pal system protein TolB, partial [Erythrobacter sp.]|nr:Tol-Pal system protein TolB [Erythrobacter sp.]
MKQPALFVLALMIASPLAAQNQDLGQPVPEGGEVETIDEGEGLSGTVSFDGNLDDLGIAIPGFATDRDVATPANSSGTAALGKELARVITADLRNNGLFKPTGPDALPQPSFGEITAPNWPTWS